MSQIHPWATGPLELLVHAEGHLRLGDDFDRRIALISFDNAIEVAITTYLTLHPIQRGNRQYQRADVDKWLTNYHTRLDFLQHELTYRNSCWSIERSYIVWVHEQRNGQYHEGNNGTPEKNVLNVVRSAAFWIFGMLFDVADVEKVVEAAVAAQLPPPPPQRDSKFDKVIDNRFGLVTVGEELYYASELLFNVDRGAYVDLGARLCDVETAVDDMDEYMRGAEDKDDDFEGAE